MQNNNINSGGSGAAYLAGSSLLPHGGKSLLPIPVTKGQYVFFSKKRACCRPKTGSPNGSLRMFDVVLVVTSLLCIYETGRALSRKSKVTDKQARGRWVIPENQSSVHPGLTDADPFPHNCLCMPKSAWCFHRVVGSWLSLRNFEYPLG